MNIVECQNCSGLIDTERTLPIRVPRLTASGEQMVDARGELLTDLIGLPYHVPMRPSYFDATGLAPASCDHGLKVHPDPRRQADAPLANKAVSWIRVRYLRDNGKAGGMASCPVCRGEPRPDDMTSGFVDPPEVVEA